MAPSDAWRERFVARRAEAVALYDENFFRMWSFEGLTSPLVGEDRKAAFSEKCLDFLGEG
jgi:hypothetical protein